LVKILNNGNWKKEKGLTVVETIVSLTVITIISIAAFSLSIYAFNTRKKIPINRYFSNLEEQSLKLYQSYEGTDFENAFNLLTGQSITYETDKTFYINKNYEYVTEESASYVLRYDFEPNSLSICAETTDAELIAERSTSK